MVNYHDPATIAQESVALVKLWHVTNGIFIWEFFTTLYYEWDVIRGKRPYSYSIARVCTLMVVILSMVGFDTTTRLNCQVWATFLLLFSYVGNIGASLLFGLRTIAVWKREKVLVITMGVLMKDIGFMINSFARFRSTWSPEANTCAMEFGSISLKLSTGAVFVTDIVSLSIMLIGLLRMRRETAGAFSLGTLGQFFWKQGLIWILIATVSEVPTVAIMILDLNVPLNLMFQTPCMIVLAIAATRMYRSLATFCSTDVCHGPPMAQGDVCAVTEMSSMRAQTGPIPLDQMMLSVCAESGPTSQSSYVGTDERRYKTHEVSLKSDVESNPEVVEK